METILSNSMNLSIYPKENVNISKKTAVHGRKKSWTSNYPPRRNMPIIRASAINEVTEPISSQLAWQTIVGALAGVTPFIVAGIEFSKRIIAQKKCSVCKGSGLVQREEYYFRCYRCGGFLPWQSWKRFFSG
eukprot:Gb_31685 [translate_table: standard]